MLLVYMAGVGGQDLVPLSLALSPAKMNLLPLEKPFHS